MKYFKHSLFIKKKHLKIVLPILAAVILIVVIVLVTSGARERSEKQKAVDAVLETGILTVGLRGDIGALCTYNSLTGQYEGLEKEVIDHVLKRIFGDEDIIIEFVSINSETKDALVSTGEIDIALGTSIYKDSSSIEYSKSFYADAGGFMVIEGEIDNQAQLEGGTIAYIQNSYAARQNDDEETKLEVYLREQGIDAQVKKYASYPEAVDALSNGHVDAVCAAGEYLKLFGKKGMLILPERFMPHEYCIETRKSLSVFCSVISDTIDDMKKDGMMEALYDIWGLVDYYEIAEES